MTKKGFWDWLDNHIWIIPIIIFLALFFLFWMIWYTLYQEQSTIMYINNHTVAFYPMASLNITAIYQVCQLGNISYAVQHFQPHEEIKSAICEEGGLGGSYIKFLNVSS